MTWIMKNADGNIVGKAYEQPVGGFHDCTIEQVDTPYEDIELFKDYREQRRAEYPEVTDQLDAIMKWLSTESEIGIPAELKSLAMTCMSVKAKYPKPEKDK